jgi:hypothetical protein
MRYEYNLTTGEVTEHEDAPVTLLTVEELAKQAQELTNSTALKYLADTDFYVIRFMDSGIAVPVDITQKREEARASVVV